MGRYITVEDIGGWLKLTNDTNDVELALTIDAAELAIDEFCGWHFDTVTEERLFFLPENRSKPIDVDPIAGDTNAAAVALITAFDIDDDGDGTYGDDWLGVDHEFVLEPLNGTLGGIRGVPRFRVRPVDEQWPSGSVGRPQARISATWGWAAIPETVKTSALILATRLWTRSQTREGAIGFEGAGIVRLDRGPDRDVGMMLKGYRHPYLNLGH